MKKIAVTLLFLITTLYTQGQTPDFQWAKQIGHIGNVNGYAITTDAQGNVYTTGRFSKTTDFDPGVGTFSLICQSLFYNMFISKVDAAGNFVWAKSFSGTGIAQAFDIKVDASGNVYTTGDYSYIIDFDPGVGTFTTICSPTGGGGIFVSKLDPLGNFVWAKQIGGPGEEAKSLALDLTGNIFITGSFASTADFDPGIGSYTMTPVGNGDAFILKLDGSGNFLWAKSYGATIGCVGNCIKRDALNNLYIGGFYFGTVNFDQGNSNFSLTAVGVGTREAFISKLDALGNFVWAKGIGSVGNDEIVSTAIDGTGNVYSSGYFNGTLDFDPGVGVFNVTAQNADEIFVLKLDASGNFVWTKSIAGGTYDHYSSIEVDAADFVYTIGSFIGTKDFDPNAGTFNLTSYGLEDVFISRLSPLGNFAGAKQLGGTSRDIGRDIVIDSFGNLCATGSFEGTADFDPGVGSYNLTSVALDLFIYKMSQTTLGLKENISKINMSMYPNPTNGSLTFEFDPESYLELSGKIQIEILNAIGQVIAKETMESNQLKIDISNFNTGIYIVKVLNENTSVATQKIIKQ
jgi:hypothetical protein